MTELAQYQDYEEYISTHILTKRMTIAPITFFSSVFISTHILTKRMTDLLHCLQHQHVYFNSHPHEEDDFISTPFSGGNYISTHILTKRMTCNDAAVQPTEIHFNSHPHEEDDFKAIFTFNQYGTFQLTSSRRG